MNCGRCFKCTEGTGCIRSVSFAPSSMPNRFPQAKTVVDRDGRWDADMPAYRRLRDNGVQPKQIDGCAELETRATEQFEVEMGTIVPDYAKSRVKEGLAITQAMENAAPKVPVNA